MVSRRPLLTCASYLPLSSLEFGCNYQRLPHIRGLYVPLMMHSCVECFTRGRKGTYPLTCFDLRLAIGFSHLVNLLAATDTTETSSTWFKFPNPTARVLAGSSYQTYSKYFIRRLESKPS